MSFSIFYGAEIERKPLFFVAADALLLRFLSFIGGEMSHPTAGVTVLGQTALAAVDMLK